MYPVQSNSLTFKVACMENMNTSATYPTMRAALNLEGHRFASKPTRAINRIKLHERQLALPHQPVELRLREAQVVADIANQADQRNDLELERAIRNLKHAAVSLRVMRIRHLLGFASADQLDATTTRVRLFTFVLRDHLAASHLRSRLKIWE